MRGHLRKRVEMRKMRRLRKEEALQLYARPARRRRGIYLSKKRFRRSRLIKWPRNYRLATRFKNKFYLRAFNRVISRKNLIKLNTTFFRRRGGVFLNKAVFTIKKRRARWSLLRRGRDEEDSDDETPAVDNDPEKSVVNTAVILANSDANNTSEFNGPLFVNDFEITQEFYRYNDSDLLVDYTQTESDSDDEYSTDSDDDDENITSGIVKKDDTALNIELTTSSDAEVCNSIESSDESTDIILGFDEIRWFETAFDNTTYTIEYFSNTLNERFYPEDWDALDEQDSTADSAISIASTDSEDAGVVESTPSCSETDSNTVLIETSDSEESDGESFIKRVCEFENTRLNGTFLNDTPSDDDSVVEYDTPDAQFTINSYMDYQYATVADYRRMVKRVYRLRNNLSKDYKLLGNVSRAFVHMNKFSKSAFDDDCFEGVTYYLANRIYDTTYLSFANFFKKISLFRSRKKTKNSLKKKWRRLRNGRKFTKRIRRYKKKNVMSILPRWGRFLLLGKQATDLTTLSNYGKTTSVVPEALYTYTYLNFMWRDFFDSEDAGKIQFVVRHASFISKLPYYDNNLMFKSFFYFDSKDNNKNRSYFNKYMEELMKKTKTLKISKKKNMPHVLLGVVSRFWGNTIPERGISLDTGSADLIVENTNVYTAHNAVEVYKVIVLLFFNKLNQ